MPRKQPCKVAENKSDVVREIPIACSNEDAAVDFLERKRWDDVPCCPRCGDTDVYKMQNREGGREAHYRWRCRGCKKQYSVRTGTVFEDSRIPLRHWCFAFWAACSSKKGVSALQIQRQTGLSYKSALFLMHRIRWAMADNPNTPPPKLSGIVEADETRIGGKPRAADRKKRGDGRKWSKKQKTIVAAAVERGGRVRAEVIPKVTGKHVTPFLKQHVAAGTTLMTDEHTAYPMAAWEIRAAEHHTVAHGSGEYARGAVTTNTIEGFFGLFKRKLNGTHHAVSTKHLHRYIDEAVFIYNHRAVDDGARTVAAIRGANGKRLKYREAVSA
ncbi:MAG: DDE transposase [Phycisphaeraceae bacterium]|nr:MAG: DDE transposase [Phycisphaeraceae bacterium]